MNSPTSSIMALDAVVLDLERDTCRIGGDLSRAQPGPAAPVFDPKLSSDVAIASGARRLPLYRSRRSLNRNWQQRKGRRAHPLLGDLRSGRCTNQGMVAPG